MGTRVAQLAAAGSSRPVLAGGAGGAGD
jgi:hypothetical protein